MHIRSCFKLNVGGLFIKWGTSNTFERTYRQEKKGKIFDSLNDIGRSSFAKSKSDSFGNGKLK